MSKIDAVVLNSHGVGQYAYADHMPVWGETLCVSNWHIAEDGGKGSNVSVALGRLGIHTAYIGKVGNDPWGDLGEKWMQNAGVDTTWLYRTSEVSTGTGLVIIGPDGQNAIIDGDSSSVKLTFKEVKAALDALTDSKLFITGFEVPELLALDAARYAKSLGMITLLNPSPLPDKPMGQLDYVDYLVINEVEARYLLGYSQDYAGCPAAPGSPISIRKILEDIQTEYGVPSIIMTLGSQGSAVLEKGEFWTIDSVKVNHVVNTAGAGDGFLAAMAAQLVLGKDLKAASRWAGKYAALTVTIDGTIPAYRPMEEVEEFIRSLG